MAFKIYKDDAKWVARSIRDLPLDATDGVVLEEIMCVLPTVITDAILDRWEAQEEPDLSTPTLADWELELLGYPLQPTLPEAPVKKASDYPFNHRFTADELAALAEDEQVMVADGRTETYYTRCFCGYYYNDPFEGPELSPEELAEMFPDLLPARRLTVNTMIFCDEGSKIIDSEGYVWGRPEDAVWYTTIGGESYSTGSSLNLVEFRGEFRPVVIK